MQILLSEDEYKDLKDKSDKYDKINKLRTDLIRDRLILSKENVESKFNPLIKFMDTIINDINKILE